VRDIGKNAESEALPRRMPEKGREKKNGVHRKVALILCRNL
jgi:hypothetical protein